MEPQLARRITNVFQVVVVLSHRQIPIVYDLNSVLEILGRAASRVLGGTKTVQFRPIAPFKATIEHYVLMEDALGLNLQNPMKTAPGRTLVVIMVLSAKEIELVK
ncbi:MAG: hypothetical protein HYS22_02295 [Deltaproteobacteria bacterium]|nr:hypothetical protein [Deltaproteobacteria bacterium]